MTNKIEIGNSPLQFVTWKDSCIESICKAEQRKSALEARGFELVRTHPQTLIYVFKGVTK